MGLNIRGVMKSKKKKKQHCTYFFCLANPRALIAPLLFTTSYECVLCLAAFSPPVSAATWENNHIISASIFSLMSGRDFFFPPFFISFSLWQRGHEEEVMNMCIERKIPPSTIWFQLFRREQDFPSVPPSCLFARLPCSDQTGKTYYAASLWETPQLANRKWLEKCLTSFNPHFTLKTVGKLKMWHRWDLWTKPDLRDPR